MTTFIIGAGMAGIAAARELKQNGENAIILEARDRIGGRVYTDHDFADHPVECGAEFLHGEHVPTWKYVRELSLTTIHWKRQEDALVRRQRCNGDWKPCVLNSSAPIWHRLL